MKTFQDRLAAWKSSKLSFHPWPFFLFFLSANALLSYAPCSITVKLFVAIFFLFLPFLLALRILRDEKSDSTGDPQVLPDPPTAFYWTLFALLLFTQFYRLDSNPFWPTMDDAREDYYSLHLLTRWDWSLLNGENQIQPLYIWLLGMLSRLLSPTRLLYSAFPAALFVLSLVAIYYSSKRLFPNGRSFLLTAFLGLSFPTYALSRFHQRHVLMFILECLLIGLLCLYFQRPNHKGVRVALGLLLAAGFYTYHSWAVVGLWVFLLLLFDALRRRRFLPLFQTGLIAFIVTSPILWLRLQPGGIAYYQSHFDYHYLGIPFLSGFFWKSHGTAPYGPNWGGWYNALAGATIFSGLLRLYQLRKQPWVLPILLGSLIFVFPALITPDPQMYRLMTLLPFFALFVALGMESVVLPFAPKHRWFLVIFLFFVSVGLDTYHYFNRYLPVSKLPQDKQSWRIRAYADAYHLMEKRFAVEGPGLVFHDFHSRYPDRSLEIYTYGFNSLQNPSLSPSAARWVAVVCDPNLKPFLEKRFPEGEWRRLGDESGFFTFGLVPREAFHPGELERWTTVHAAFVEATRRALYKRPTDSWDILSPPLEEAKKNLGEDPFLWSVYAEKAAQHFSVLGNLRDALSVLKEGVRKGYPSALLLNRRGCLLSLSRHFSEARLCFQKACAAPANFTNAEQNLSALRARGSTTER